VCITFLSLPDSLSLQRNVHTFSFTLLYNNEHHKPTDLFHFTNEMPALLVLLSTVSLVMMHVVFGNGLQASDSDVYIS
jgi:hypothetical protein